VVVADLLVLEIAAKGRRRLSAIWHILQRIMRAMLASQGHGGDGLASIGPAGEDDMQMMDDADLE